MKIRKHKTRHVKTETESELGEMIIWMTNNSLPMQAIVKTALLQFSWAEHHIKFNPPTIRLVKYRARQQGFDVDCEKREADGDLIVSRVRFKTRKDHTVFLLKWY